MIDFFRNLNITSSSFWLGFLSGILFAWILSRLFVYLPKAVRALRKNVGGIRENLSTSGDARLRNDVYRFAQKQHIASSLFSLDEIVVVPKVLTPLVQSSKSIELAPTDSVSLTVPYIPDWPELAAVYRASTMTVLEALQGGANIILAGHPGSGKTVAMAWLASALSRNVPGLGVMEGALPLYVHATEIYQLLKRQCESRAIPDGDETGKSSTAGHNPQKKGQDTSTSLDILVKAISIYASPLTLTRLPSMVRSAVDRQRAILLIDRMDELPPYQSSEVAQYLQGLLVMHPKLRIITALSYDDLAGLPAHGFSLLALASWGDEERDYFLNRWSIIWTKWFYKSDKNQQKKINPQYLNSWLKVENTLLKPLEYTLKVWAAYSGDILGPDGPSAIEAYIRRTTMDGKDTRLGLEQFALQVVDEMCYSANPHEAAQVLSERPPESESSSEEVSAENSVPEIQPQTAKSPKIIELSNIDSLLNNGILVSYAGSAYGFSHPIFYSYLAGNALLYLGEAKQIISQPHWIGKTLTMYYFARNGDVSPFINELIQDDDILHTNHLNIARWLQIAPKTRQWRSNLLRTLISILQKEKETASLAAKIVTALAFSGDTGISIYFRQLLKSDHAILKPLAALGCGILGEKKAIEDLNLLLHEDSPASIRTASLALAAIGDKQSLEILASTLLNGSELARRCAAEALANNPVEGHPALKDGSTMEDLLVRRSVAFGLIRVNQPWAVKIVENMQLEDNEWVVRNAALQAFDEYQRKISYAPKPLADPTELDWLTNYAAKTGTSVAPGKPADDLIVKALTNGSQDEILYALDYLRLRCDVDSIEYIYAAYTNNTGEIKDTAYHVLWLMMISGIKLPTSIKYNID